MKSFAGAYVNLLKTSIGSGVLSFPFLFKTYGVIPTIIFTIISGYFATTGLVLLTVCSQVLGRSADMSKLASVTFPYARFFVDLAVFAKCFGVSLSYIIIAKQLIPSITSLLPTQHIFPLPPKMSLLIFLGFAGPFAYFNKLDKLKYTSFVGIFSIMLVIIAAIFRYLKMDAKDLPKFYFFGSVNQLWITGLGKFIFSFTCHQNIFAVNAELEDNSMKRMNRLIFTVSLSSFTLYISFGLTNYFLYSNDVVSNVLNNYPQDLLATIVRGLYIIVMGVSFPLQLAPARTYMLNMLGISKRSKNYEMTYFVTTTVLIALTYIIAISEVELGIVYSIVGATASCFMCLILPALFYFNLEIERTLWLSIAAYFGFLLGVFIFVTTIFTLLIGVNVNH